MPKRTVTSVDRDTPGERARTFEEAYAELEAIVAALEKGELPLEESLQLHTRGQELSTLCAKMLDEAELRLRQLQPAA